MTFISWETLCTLSLASFGFCWQLSGISVPAARTTCEKSNPAQNQFFYQPATWRRALTRCQIRILSRQPNLKARDLTRKSAQKSRWNKQLNRLDKQETCKSKCKKNTVIKSEWPNIASLNSNLLVILCILSETKRTHSLLRLLAHNFFFLKL